MMPKASSAGGHAQRASPPEVALARGPEPTGPPYPPAPLLPGALVTRFQAGAAEDAACNPTGAGPLGDLALLGVMGW